MTTLDFLRQRIQEFGADREVCLRATRHLSKRIKEGLFSSRDQLRRNAEGHWYEALIYEIVLHLSEESELIRGVVRKRADAPKKRPKPSLNQNGLYYDPDRYLVIRGHGQALGEIDLMLLDDNSDLIFIEVVISRQNLRGFVTEIDHKRALLREIVDQPTIPFLLISSVDLTNRQNTKRFLENQDNFYMTGPAVEETKVLLDKKIVLGGKKSRSKSSKLVDLKDITVNVEFDYERMHDKARDMLYGAIERNTPLDDLKAEVGDNPIVSKVVLGCLHPNAMRLLFCERHISINRKTMSVEDSKKFFDRLILAVNLPELRPVLYLKVREKFLRTKWKRTYLKLGPRKARLFTFERNISSHFGFHMWLEDTKPTIGKELTRSVLQYFLRNEILGYGGKHEKPNIDI
ncbi:MAG: hypothetical protein KAR39_05365 [Thermoplasmata archaeon]|nr:hypothetical protein [Thermoplasmata archaeon]